MEGRPIHTRVGRHFGIGVVGLGKGKGLVKGLHRHPDLRLVAVCDTDSALAAEVAQRYGVPHHGGEACNYAEAFARGLVTGETPQPDAVDGFKTMATLEAIRTAIRSGQPARVEQL